MNNAQTFENNYGNNAQNVYGDQVLNNHYHLAPNKNKGSTYEITINHEEINNNVIIDSIIKKLLKLKVLFLTNSDMQLFVKTKKFTNLEHEINATKDLLAKNALINQLCLEAEKSQRAHCFFNYIIRGHFPLETSMDIEVFKETLNLVLKYEMNYSLSAEAQQIDKFLNYVDIIKGTNKDILEFEKEHYKDWLSESDADGDVGFYVGTEIEYEKDKADILLYLNNLERDLKIQEELEIEKHVYSLKIDFTNLDTWLYLPFRLTFTTRSGMKFSTFNRPLITHPKKEYCRWQEFINSFNDEDYLKILSRFYLSISLFSFLKGKSDDTPDSEIISREIDFDPLQKKLREIFKKYDTLSDTYWEYTDFSSIDDEWRDEMLNSYGC